MPKWPKRKSFWVLLRREPVAMETQSGRREAFAPTTGSRIWGSRPMTARLPINGARVVVLSRGMAECLRVPGETLDFLKERWVEAHILPTTEAAELYNRLGKQGPVGGLFHTTC